MLQALGRCCGAYAHTSPDRCTPLTPQVYSISTHHQRDAQRLSRREVGRVWGVKGHTRNASFYYSNHTTDLWTATNKSPSLLQKYRPTLHTPFSRYTALTPAALLYSIPTLHNRYTPFFSFFFVYTGLRPNALAHRCAALAPRIWRRRRSFKNRRAPAQEGVSV